MFAKFPPELAEPIRAKMSGMTVRIGIFFLLHAALATWAALHWSTQAWVFLKGFGFTGSMVVYMIVEALFLRRGIRAKVVSAEHA